MVLTRSQISKLLKQRDALHDTDYTVWVGATAETAIQVLNDDGSVPFVHPIEPKDEILLGLDTGYTNTRPGWKMTKPDDPIPGSWMKQTTLGNYLPDTNLQWWISADDGASKQRVSVLRNITRSQQSHEWIYLIQ